MIAFVKDTLVTAGVIIDVADVAVSVTNNCLYSRVLFMCVCVCVYDALLQCSLLVGVFVVWLLVRVRIWWTREESTCNKGPEKRRVCLLARRVNSSCLSVTSWVVYNICCFFCVCCLPVYVRVCSCLLACLLVI